MLLTRAPLYSQDCSRFLVRLACVRHAASVDSEPGSNSRLILGCSPPTDRGRGGRAPSNARKDPKVITSENDRTKVRPISRLATFNYVVKDPNCIRLGGQLWIKDSTGIARYVSSNLERHKSSVLLPLEHSRPFRFGDWPEPDSESHLAAHDVLRELFKIIEL